MDLRTWPEQVVAFFKSFISIFQTLTLLRRITAQLVSSLTSLDSTASLHNNKHFFLSWSNPTMFNLRPALLVILSHNSKCSLPIT